MKNNRTERLQVMTTTEMRRQIEHNATMLNLSISSYLELLIGAGLSNKPSKTIYNMEDI